jgi:hypothetical protein
MEKKVARMRKSAHMRLQRTRSQWRDRVYFAMDIEYTRADGTFIEGCIGDEHTQQFFDNWGDMLEAMFAQTSRNTWYIVHAGDIAEFSHLIKYVRTTEKYRNTLDIEPVYSGQNMIALSISRGKKKIQIRDMFALFPMSLDKISQQFAPEYPKLCDSVDFSKRDYNPDTDREYLRRDVQATCASYKAICALIYKHFGVQPSLSAAGTAMRAWLYELPEDKKYFRLSPVVEDFCREAYYGAYVHPGKDNNIHFNVVSYDVTAAYGARMRYAYPIGNPVHSEYYRSDKLGIWTCTVTCVDAPLPIVPYRKNNGINWLGIPGDQCQTTVTNLEIEYFKAHGYTVEVHYGVYWMESDTIFKDFIDKVEQVESLNSTTKQCAKLMRNSLYGRFGAKKYIEKFVIAGEPGEEMIPYCNPSTGELIEDLYVINEELDVPYIQPHWASFITAYQRLAMFELIQQCGLENFLGCDTDSVKTYKNIVEEKQLPISETEYGKGKIEASWSVYRSHGPKNYVGIRDDEDMKRNAKDTKKIQGKSKGIPKKAVTENDLIKHLYRDEKTNLLIKFASPTKALTMLKQDGRVRQIEERKRTLSSLHSEKWELKDCCFIPVANTLANCV